MLLRLRHPLPVVLVLQEPSAADQLLEPALPIRATAKVVTRVVLLVPVATRVTTLVLPEQVTRATTPVLPEQVTRATTPVLPVQATRATILVLPVQATSHAVVGTSLEEVHPVGSDLKVVDQGVLRSIDPAAVKSQVEVQISMQ